MSSSRVDGGVPLSSSNGNSPIVSLAQHQQMSTWVGDGQQHHHHHHLQPHHGHSHGSQSVEHGSYLAGPDYYYHHPLASHESRERGSVEDLPGPGSQNQGPLPSMEWRHAHLTHHHSVENFPTIPNEAEPEAASGSRPQQQPHTGHSPSALIANNGPLEPGHFPESSPQTQKHLFPFESVHYSGSLNAGTNNMDEHSESSESDKAALLLSTSNSSLSESDPLHITTANHGHSLRLKPHSTPATLCWLDKNYELSEGVCIPRNVVYYNYVDFCSKNHMQPVNAASFGKIIRQMFANLTTRRLGTRGQSRYHYYGLAVKTDSIYYSPNYSSRKLTEQQMDMKIYPKMSGKSGFHSTINPNDLLPHSFVVDHLNGGSSSAASSSPTSLSSGIASPISSSGFSTVQQLPDFPSFREFAHATSIPGDKLQTLITMYRAHCQRIMDSVNKFSFSEIPHLFTHFWQEIPPHIAGLLGQNVVVTLVGVCDAILYRTILKAILPTAVQMFPENVLKIIRKFADDVVGSLQFSLKQVPENLIYVKMKLVRQMSKMLKRRTSVNHLYQAACLLINSSTLAVFDEMAQDWHKLDVRQIVDECGSKICGGEEITAICRKFHQLLFDKTCLSQICLWSTSLVETHTKEHGSNALCEPSSTLIGKVRRFLIVWTSVSTKILKQLKEVKPNASSTSSFHFIQLLLNEHILHDIERLLCEDSMKELMLNLGNAQATELSDSSFIDSLGPDFLSHPNIFPGNCEASPMPPCIAHSLKDSKRSFSQSHGGGEVGRKMIKLEKSVDYEKQDILLGKLAPHYWNCPHPNSMEHYADSNAIH